MGASLIHLFDFTDTGAYKPSVERIAAADVRPVGDEAGQVRAAANAAMKLFEHGLEIEIDENEADTARDIFSGKTKLDKQHFKQPAIILKLRSLLDEYDHEVLRDATQIRRFVTNRLLEESNDNDPRIRMKALELLGKITEVGLFSERSIVTIEHKTTAELEAALKENLAILLPTTQYSEVDE